ncbi:hypothetical protein HQS73_004009 [Salmonella enterica]|nr:hypothetical protein [Salmonella enterica]
MKMLFCLALVINNREVIMSLPLREYYTIDRASELLGCTVDDLIHWAMVGCIRIYIKVERAYGVVVSQDLSELAGSGDFDEVMEGTKYKNDLSELDTMVEVEDKRQADISDTEYYNLRARIVYHAMNDYIYKKGDVKCLDDVGMRHIFSNLHYHFAHQVTEDFCSITSLEMLCRMYRNDANSFKDVLNNVPYELSSSVVDMRGFFGLGEGFYRGYNFCNGFVVNTEGEYINSVYMPESNLCVNVISDCDINFSHDVLFIMKNDFLAIKEALRNESELKKKYPYHRISNNHGWWKCFASGDENKQSCDVQNKNNGLSENTNSASKLSRKPHVAEMHARKRESVLKAAIYIKVNHPDLCGNNTKWAEAISDHAYKFWDDGKCPLSLEVTAKLLGKALNPKK